MTSSIRQVGSRQQLDLGETTAGTIDEAIETFKESAQMIQMIKLPNFQFQYLAPPVGYCSVFNHYNKFRGEAVMGLDQFRTLTVVKLRAGASFFTTEKLIEIEKKVSICLPEINFTPPIQKSKADQGYGIAFQKRGNSIGIYKHHFQDKDNDHAEDIFYVVLHHSLADSLIKEIQEKDKNLTFLTDEILSSAPKEETLIRAGGRDLTFAERFCSEEYQEIEEIAKEGAKRLIYCWSQIAGVELDCHVTVLDDVTYDIPQIDDFKLDNSTIVREAFESWPKGVPIYPFSHFPSNFSIKQLRSYPIGLVASKANQLNQPIQYDNSIVTFTPDVQTIYNYPSSSQNILYYYNHSCPINHNRPFIHHKGLTFGYDIYNYDVQTRTTTSEGLTNDFLNSFPVLFPYSSDLLNNPTEETTLKFFSKDSGGRLHSKVIPKQLQGKFINPNLTSEEISLLLPHRTTIISLEPIHVFLSDECTNEPQFKIK